MSKGGAELLEFKHVLETENLYFNIIHRIKFLPKVVGAGHSIKACSVFEKIILNINGNFALLCSGICCCMKL